MENRRFLMANKLYAIPDCKLRQIQEKAGQWPATPPSPPSPGVELTSHGSCSGCTEIKMFLKMPSRTPWFCLLDRLASSLCCFLELLPQGQALTSILLSHLRGALSTLNRPLVGDPESFFIFLFNYPVAASYVGHLRFCFCFCHTLWRNTDYVGRVLDICQPADPSGVATAPAPIPFPGLSLQDLSARSHLGQEGLFF